MKERLERDNASRFCSTDGEGREGKELFSQDTYRYSLGS